MTLKTTLINQGKKALLTIAYIAKEEVMFAVESYKVKSLIRKAHAKDRIERTLARAKLKKWFPEVFEVLDL